MRYSMIVIMVITSLWSFNASALVVNRELTAEQEATLLLQAAKMEKENVTATASSAADEATKWVNVGKSIGVGFASTAKELGVAADELLSTKVGSIAMFLIVWNYIGDQLLGVIGSLLWFAVMLPAWGVYFKRIIMRPVITYENGKKAKVEYEGGWKNSSDGAIAAMVVSLFFICAAGFIMLV